MQRIASAIIFFGLSIFPIFTNAADSPQLPSDLNNIINQPRYAAANWGIYVTDLTANEVKYHTNTQKMFIPASVCKLFAVQALLNTYGYEHVFQTPIYALGKIHDGILDGDLVLVAKGDLTLGGRHTADNKIAYTNLDHGDANSIPGASLTAQDPLNGIKLLAKQIRAQGIRSINGTVLIDTRLFETIKKRENVLSPIMINDNLIDIVVEPTATGNAAKISWRPQISTISVINKVTTVSAGKEAKIDIAANASGTQITVTGTIASGQKILNTYTIEDPESFAKTALIEALKQEGIKINTPAHDASLPDQKNYSQLKPIATLTSEPLLEYAKLVLKVSSNVGANLVPLLLASYHGESQFIDGMQYMGKFISDTVHIDPKQISFGDAAGGNDNYATPAAIMKLLTYIYQNPAAQFQKNIYTLPILGVDGSLAFITQQTPATGKVFAKTGTGVIYNMLQGNFFLTSKAIAGYMQLKNQHWVAFVIVVNNTAVKNIDEVLAINNDIGTLAIKLYENLNARTE